MPLPFGTGTEAWPSLPSLATSRSRKRADGASLLLSAIVDSSDDAIVSKDLNGVITSWNQSAERLFGYTAAEAIGQPVATLLIPPDRQEEEPRYPGPASTEASASITSRRNDGRKDGTLLDISLTISPVKDPLGKIIGASKIARDISESKRLQDVLVASEARFRQLADAMPQIVWTARSLTATSITSTAGGTSSPGSTGKHW